MMAPILGRRFASIAIVGQNSAKGFYEDCVGKKSMKQKGVRCNLACSHFSVSIPSPLLLDEAERVVRKIKIAFLNNASTKGSSLVSMQSKVFFCRQEPDCTEQFPL